MTRDEIILHNPLDAFLRSRDVPLRGNNGHLLSTRCPKREHKKDHWCVTIDPRKGLFHCNDCEVGGTIIDWRMHEEGKTAAEILKEYGDKEPPPPSGKPQIVATYDYTDENGNLLYQVVRFVPKDFRQRQPDDKGGWRWTMEGATRVLFNLPKVLQSSTVAICEGEKDCVALEGLGYVATCNVGGAGKWLPAYADVLAGKDILIFPDNDDPGRKHADSIHQSLAEKAASIKRITVPSPSKDVADFIKTFPDAEQASAALGGLIKATAHSLKPAPLYTIQEMEREYMEFLRDTQDNCFELSRFLPALGAKAGRLVRGELVLIMGDTGTAKTALIQNIARAARPLPTLIFELELPIPLMFERFVQMQMPCQRHDVEENYREHRVPLWSKYDTLQHIIVCPESGLTTEQIEGLIVKSQLKFGRPPVLVCVDYVGLIKDKFARARYEAISNSAEQLKVIAKRTNTIIVMTSQIGREAGKREKLEVRLHDGKDSGALENSAGLVLGCWRPEKSRLILKVLKNTKGPAGTEIECEFNGETMRISQKSLMAD